MVADKSVVFIAGPTAGGKSALALALAEAVDGVIINADSMQLYAGLPILSAQPDAADLGRAPHRLYGVIDPADACSAARWRDLALAAIETAWAGGKMPLLVGGTGLYFRVLEHGIARMPDIPPSTRQAARALLAAEGPAALHRRLAAVDPDSAARLAPGDSQRLVRAWEVWQATATPLSHWQRQKAEGGLAGRADVALHRFMLARPRAEIYARIERRLLAMIEQGARDEVARLLARGLDPDLPAMKALGVRPLAAHLAGDLDLEAAIGLAQRDSRRYAKRQWTWARHQCGDWHWQDAQENVPFNLNNFLEIIL